MPAHVKENGFVSNSNSFGFPASTRDDFLPIASTSDESRFMDQRIDGSRKITAVAALKELVRCHITIPLPPPTPPTPTPSTHIDSHLLDLEFSALQRDLTWSFKLSHHLQMVHLVKEKLMHRWFSTSFQKITYTSFKQYYD